MYLPELIDDIGGIELLDNNALEVKGITDNSRLVQKGFIFSAIKGRKLDGEQFIAEAIKAGAVAILTASDAKVKLPSNIAWLRAKNPRAALAKIAAKFYPQQVAFQAAVTGTNGKSSTVNFTREIWQILGEKSASLGTIGISALGVEKYGSLTTPDPVTLHREIENLAKAGVTHLALEASSQGLDQFRMDGLKIKAAGFTNLTRDHLDYHGGMEEYFKAKARLFTELLHHDGIAVLNADSDYFAKFKALCDKRRIKVVDFGCGAKDIKLCSQKPHASGQYLSLEVFGKKYEVDFPLVGDFQAHNAMCALGFVLAEDLDNKDLQDRAVMALSKLSSVRGRLELAAKLKCGAAVYVDYAHTPDAIETVLKAIKPHVAGRLHVLFGCGGDRDRGKRPLMGKAAVELADVVIVTDDNPRSEDAAFIRSEVMAGAKGAREIADRALAIKAAVKDLKAGDVLIAAGKGHEQGQIIGNETIPFDDVMEIKKAIMEQNL